jgi:hypothetical protein
MKEYGKRLCSYNLNILFSNISMEKTISMRLIIPIFALGANASVSSVSAGNADKGGDTRHNG